MPMNENKLIVGVLRVLRILLKVIPYFIALLDKSGDRLAQYIDDSKSPET